MAKITLTHLYSYSLSHGLTLVSFSTMKDVFFIVGLFEDDVYGGDRTLFPKSFGGFGLAHFLGVESSIVDLLTTKRVQKIDCFLDYMHNVYLIQYVWS